MAQPRVVSHDKILSDLQTLFETAERYISAIDGQFAARELTKLLSEANTSFRAIVIFNSLADIKAFIEQTRNIKIAAAAGLEALEEILGEFDTSGDDGAPPEKVARARNLLLSALQPHIEPEPEHDPSELPF